MRGKAALLLVTILIIVFIGASCTYYKSGPQVVIPSEAKEEASQLDVQDIPQPTAKLPVTNQDISPFFMPGLSEIGTVPEGEYKIGIIINKDEDEQSWWSELCSLRDEYKEKFNIEILAELTGDSSQKQIDKAEEMIADGIDFLILSPSNSERGAKIGDLCEQHGVPYITMNKRIDKTPGQDGYICTIEQDEYMLGVLSGISIVSTMTQIYGHPKGNIGEITGEVSDAASSLRSMGIRRVFAEYEELNVVCSVVGDYDEDTIYKAAVNLLKAFRKGELDGVIAVCDDTAVQTLQAILDMDRQELIGNIWSMGANKSGLTSVWYGDFAQTVECTCQTGMVALEYALQYLEGQGEDIPPIVFAMTRVFSADTPEKADGIAAIIEQMSRKGTDRCFESMGEYELFLPDMQKLRKYYPKHYYEYPDAQAYLSIYEPYTTGEAFYTEAEEETP